MTVPISSFPDVLEARASRTVITLGLSDSGFLPALLLQCLVCLVCLVITAQSHLAWNLPVDQAGLELASVLLLPPESVITATCYDAQLT